MSGILPPLHQHVNGAASATTTAATTLIAAPSAGRLCVSALQLCRNDAGTTPITITLNDGAGTVLGLPNAGNGKSDPYVFDAPIILPAKQALTFQASSAITTVFASAQGFIAE